MAGPIVLMPTNQQPTMSAKVTHFEDNVHHVGFSEDSKEFDGTDFKASEFPTEKRPMQKMSSMKKVGGNGLKKMPSAKAIGWSVPEDLEDTESLKTSSDQSESEKNEFNRPSLADDRRRPSFYHDFSGVANSKVAKALSKYDEELDNILLNQSPDLLEPVIAVNLENLQTIKLLGKGQFCNVHSVAGSFLMNEHEQRQVKTGKRSIYALKSLNPKTIENDDELIIAALDLANEARLLAELDHPNIIKLRGLCCETFSKSFAQGRSVGSSSTRDVDGAGGKDASRRSLAAFKSASKKSISRSMGKINRSLKRIGSTLRLSTPTNGIEGYFLMLDVLSEILQDTLKRQRKENAKKRKPMSKAKRKEQMFERVERTAIGIAEGMRHLHAHDIVLRDLKPGNVGFDNDLNVRLFDFGMARKVDECIDDEICGSPRYMAPEVMEGKGYSLKVDVFSFAIVLFELCTLQVPYADTFAAMHQEQKQKKWDNIKNCFQRKPKVSEVAQEVVDEADEIESTSTATGLEPHQENLLLEFYRKVVFEEVRPATNLSSIIPCNRLAKLIKECWSPNPEDRPSFDEICPRLHEIFAP